MNNEIKEILDRLERIDHKEYSCGFEFADSSSFDEDCRCFEERKKIANYITNLQQENKQLKDDLNMLKNDLLKENQELKLELSGYRHAILNNKEMLGLKEQNDKLKKQVEEALQNYEKEAYIVDKQTRQLTDEYKNTKYQSDKVNSLLTQQKEFINYLEDMLDDENDIFSVVRVKDVLQKYQEIIGDDK